MSSMMPFSSRPDAGKYPAACKEQKKNASQEQKAPPREAVWRSRSMSELSPIEKGEEPLHRRLVPPPDPHVLAGIFQAQKRRKRFLLTTEHTSNKLKT
ncbi:hypothetical protein [Rhizobium leguminosarum]|uniref:hypothetical protein n=1 Tax=Rhizobium leguminosarum TaxID=384 RepID=UPI0011AE9401|nr:hypothetical protein [Rhizobium leguminosarum]